ncbi:MAG: cold shock domain-containing protein [Bacteroidetes bacterium]|nr:cold shock domain-containing protein [Bacteroidota bacterium]
MKLGKVKFFDSIKGFGYIHSFDDKKECFVHASKLITLGIDEDDIVLFESINSKKKPGELDAINVTNQIPVFIVNKESTTISQVFPLLPNYLEKEISLSRKHETGFAIVTATNRGQYWRISIMPSESISKSESISLGEK